MEILSNSSSRYHTLQDLQEMGYLLVSKLQTGQ